MTAQEAWLRLCQKKESVSADRLIGKYTLRIEGVGHVASIKLSGRNCAGNSCGHVGINAKGLLMVDGFDVVSIEGSEFEALYEAWSSLHLEQIRTELQNRVDAVKRMIA